ncbi:acetyl-CoA C-acetyltransferase [Bacillus alkalicellulosilyticus]|uniref:acetyl-CoA C-acetyltransferase n=1 Tax=Alkalihalobacterium alkalicellulosilyticum TaxID=1912214 RepID=UPI0009984923|nr:acetyl-CoA C-acetyltransferase [Bacillus alkalicellulosilyticus]
MEGVYIVDGARTPFGSYGKAFATVSATELGVLTAKEAIQRAEMEANEIDNIVYGNVIQSSTNAAYLARHIGLNANVPIETPALTVNRLCGSGMQSLISAAQSMLLNESNIALVGGAENMSMSPHASFTSRFAGMKYGSMEFVDMLTHTLTDEYIGTGMGITAETLAERYKITREEQDEFALQSQWRAKEAKDKKYTEEEIIPVNVGADTVSFDEHPKPDVSKQQLSHLRPVFKKDGTVTSGNASGINDGAVSLILVNGLKRATMTKKPLAKIVSWAVAGVDPAQMGIGPVPAIQKALQKANLSLEKIDRFEINEAFAAQYLAVEKELGLQREITNVNGGAIAYGHPVGASGTRIVLSLAYELKRKGLRYGVASLCIGGGQGIALIIENINNE